MSHILDKLVKAQQYAMSIRPKKAGFPVLAEVLRQNGILKNSWTLPSCQSVYITIDGGIVQPGTPLMTIAQEIPAFDREALVSAIRMDQEGLSTFPEFLQSSWEAGVIRYDVDFIARHVIYYGINGESYLEEYPAIEL